MCTDEIQLMYAGDMMYTLALFPSRLSVCLFFRRLSASTQKTMVPNILTCVCAALGITSVFVVGLRQRVSEPWVQDPTTVSMLPSIGDKCLTANM